MDELERRFGQAKSSLATELERVEIPDLTHDRSHGRSYAPLAVAAVLVTVVTVGAFLVASRSGDDVVLTEPSSNGSAPDDLPTGVPLGSLVSDRVPRAVTPVEMVAPGDTFTEPDFGTSIRRITSSEPGSVTAPASSTSQVFNADGTLLLLYRTGVESPGHVVVDVATGEVVDTPDLSAATDIEDIAWDATDPTLLHYLDPTTASIVDLELQGVPIVRPVDEDCARADFGGTVGAGAGRSSTLTVVCRDGDAVDWVAIDTGSSRELARRPAIPTADGSVDAPSTMASGRGFVLLDDASIVVLDTALAPTGIVVDIDVSAATLALDSEGRDVLVATVFDDLDGDVTGTAVEVDLGTGTQRVITGESTGYPYPPTGTTMGVVGGPDSTLVAIATSPGSARPALLEDEILLVDVATDTTFRLAHHRMIDADEFGNWSTPYVAVSPDGTTVAFSSNFGGDAVDTYLISIPDVSEQ